MNNKHLHRLASVFETQPLYFVTTCVVDRDGVRLDRENVKDLFVSEWTSALQFYGWTVGSFVLMPDHVHFFARPAQTAVTLSMFVGKWKERTSKALKKLGNPTPLWQREFFDHIIRSSESYAEKWRYVENNPVRAGLVASAVDWPYRGHVHFI